MFAKKEALVEFAERMNQLLNASRSDGPHESAVHDPQGQGVGGAYIVVSVGMENR